jgi:TRAP transporter TAXI family solute receptor
VGPRPFAFVAAAALVLAGGSASADDLRLFTVGAGDVGGGYYAAASAICDRLNQVLVGKLRCSPEATPGSLYNLMALREGQLDFALVQSDWQRFAYEGKESFAKTGAITDLRSVMSLYPEAITVLARRDAGIIAFKDLIGKRVDVGHPASGRNATARRLIAALGDPGAFAAIVELPSDTAVDELCAGRIDATILIFGHPNATTSHALRDCHAVLVPLDGVAAELLGKSADYQRTVISGAAYPGLTGDVATFAVTATLVTRAGTAADEVNSLVSETLAGLPELRVTAPLFVGIRPMEMEFRGLTAPLHDGAKSAFARSRSQSAIGLQEVRPRS